MQLAAAQQAIPLVNGILQLQQLIADIQTIQGDGSFVVGSPTIQSPTLGPNFNPVCPPLTVAESATLFAPYLTILQARLAQAEAALAAL